MVSSERSVILLKKYVYFVIQSSFFTNTQFCKFGIYAFSKQQVQQHKSYWQPTGVTFLIPNIIVNFLCHCFQFCLLCKNSNDPHFVGQPIHQIHPFRCASREGPDPLTPSSTSRSPSTVRVETDSQNSTKSNAIIRRHDVILFVQLETVTTQCCFISIFVSKSCSWQVARLFTYQWISQS